MAKYAEIRAAATQAQVVRQVWLAYPSAGGEIEPRDEFVSWTSTGPSTGDEFVFGSLGLVPVIDAAENATDEASPVTVRSLAGMLLYFGVQVANGSA